MSVKRERALALFAEGFNCAQSVVAAFCEDIGLERDAALKGACGFGAGMGRCQEVCGAVSGGVMAIGVKYGKGISDDNAAKEATYKKVHSLLDRFADKHGTVICGRLLKDCDLATAEGQKFFKENDLANKACRTYVESVVELLEDLM
jgi:C_GCAxxG_C_C family probable redox protein